MSSLLQSIHLWEKKLEAIDGIVRLQKKDNFETFSHFLSSHWQENSDGIAYSPAYYYFTGRKGSWAFWGQDSVCFLCWHPNRPGQILIYPQIGAQNESLIDKLVNVLPTPPNGLQLARIPIDDSHKNFSKRILSNTTVSEPVLDWKYPVRVLSTKKATEKSGAALHPVRSSCRKLNLAEVTTKPLSHQDVWSLYRVGQKYANAFLRTNGGSPLSFDDIISSNYDMLMMCLENPDIFKSFVTYYHGQPEGLFVWEEISSRSANGVWFLYNREIPGLSYWQMVQGCEMLKGRGIEILNIGGSETEGMDFFKTRFRPVQSFDLRSTFLTLKEESAVAEKIAS